MDSHTLLQYQALSSTLHSQNPCFYQQQMLFHLIGWKNSSQFGQNTFELIDLNTINEIQSDILKYHPNSQQNSLKEQKVGLNSPDLVMSTKLEPDFKTEASSFEEDKIFTKYIKEEANNYKRESNALSEEDEKPFSNKNHNITRILPLQDEISNMLTFFIKRLGKACQNEIRQQRIKYIYNNSLLQVFDILLEKYHVSTKSREDMVQLCLRKALAFLRNKIKNELQTTQRGASLALCKKYFRNISLQIKLQENSAGKEIDEKILNFLLPFQKNSRNKTPNASFIKEIFSSEAFMQDYILFLAKFDEILSSENLQKISRFNNFIFDCLTNCAIDKISGYVRIPWLDFWNEATKVLARELLDIYGWKEFNKKSKE